MEGNLNLKRWKNLCRKCNKKLFLIVYQVEICYDNLIEFLCQMEEYHEKKTSFKGTYDQR